MNRRPESPIFVLEGHDLGIYRTLDRAEGDLEPPDVAEGIYSAFDALGRRLKIETDGKSTTITLAESAASDKEDLEAALREALGRLGEHRSIASDCDLPCLVDLAGKYAI